MIRHLCLTFHIRLQYRKNLWYFVSYGIVQPVAIRLIVIMRNPIAHVTLTPHQGTSGSIFRNSSGSFLACSPARAIAMATAFRFLIIVGEFLSTEWSEKPLRVFERPYDQHKMKSTLADGSINHIRRYGTSDWML